MSTLAVNTIQAQTGTNISMTSGHTMQPNLHSSTVFPAGHVIQLLHTSHSTEKSMSNTSWANTDLQLSITPKFSTSKIYVLYIMQFRILSTNSDSGIGFRLLRNGTVVEQATTTYDNYTYDGGGQTEHRGSDTETYLDSPATTSTLTYGIQGNPYSGTVRVHSDNNRSRITLMEIAQ